MTRMVLLLTACIHPGGMKYTVLQDAEERKRQYKSAIGYYLANTKCRIVFCENSSADLSDLMDSEYTSRIEFLSFFGNGYDANYGKGFGEFLIMQYAFENSRFIKESSMVIKVTGRLIVENLREIVMWQGRIFGNQRNCFFANGISNRKIIDSRCFIASKNFYVGYFLTGKIAINDSKGYYFEHYLFDRVKELPDAFVVSGFVIPISIAGQSGTSGAYYKRLDLCRYEKLRIIDDYCQREKSGYMKSRPMVYLRMCVVSFFVRAVKAVFIR